MISPLPLLVLRREHAWILQKMGFGAAGWKGALWMCEYLTGTHNCSERAESLQLPPLDNNSATSAAIMVALSIVVCILM